MKPAQTSKAPTAKAISILAAIMKGNHQRTDLAKKLKLSIPALNGSLRNLKRDGLVEQDPETDTLDITEDAKQFVVGKSSGTTASGASTQRAERKGTKTAKARKLFERFLERGRPVVLQKMQEQAGLTANGAATYFQKFRADAGLSLAHQKRKPAARPVKAKAKASKAKAKK
jgi:hypothetical protein